MTQTTTGWRAALSVPSLYRSVQASLGGPRVRRTIVEDYLRPAEGDAVLDIGCGTGDLAPYLTDYRYVGFDLSEAYIESARDRHGPSADFRVGSVGEGVADGERFDRAIAKGVVHHLDDEQAISMFTEAHDALRPGGWLVTMDPCLVAGQSRIAREIIRRDRGQNVRTPEGYTELAESVFANVEITVRHDLLRVPYTHAILVCST